MLDYIPRLAEKRIVLASQSPRRKELLKQIGLKCTVIPSGFDETLPKDNFTGKQYAEETALQKALDIASKYSTVSDLVIGADTVVELEGHILEKPHHPEDARHMIEMLSGSTHDVHTGVALVVPGRNSSSAFVHTFCVTTAVTFSSISAEAIEEYVASGEAYGKAGSYGIQGKAAVFVSGIQGCYFNVVGLPLNALCSNLGLLIENGQLSL